jgi:16S rRNA (cytosine967-C5)-methyltransferase
VSNKYGGPRHRQSAGGVAAPRIVPVAPARGEALRVLLRVERDRAFADIALEHALEASRLDPRDAALCTEIVYGTLRWQRNLDWRLGPHLRRPLDRLDPWVRALLRLSAYQLCFLDRVPHWAAVDEAVSLARLRTRSTGPAQFVNAVLRGLARAEGPPPEPDDPVEAAAVRWSFPTWLAARWISRLGQRDAEALMAALDERPPLTVRANLLRATRDDLAARLRNAELAGARATTLAPEGLVLDRWSAGRSNAFAEGWCTVQDEASMLVARLLAPRPGETIADACAAPGTKTTHLVELMGGRGRVIATDPQANRVKLLQRAAQRLGAASCVEARVGTAGTLVGDWGGRCDGVLVDAPCSGLGVLRRNPEVKWRRSPDDLRRLAARQREILSDGAALARPGGRLVYATCSLEPEENEAVVFGFLDGHPGWAVDAPASDFPVAADARGMIRLQPDVHHTDGFTLVRLRREGSR